MPTDTTHSDLLGVDLTAVRDWMDAQGLGSGDLTAASPIGGGTQNVMLGFERSGVHYVLRRGPKHLRPHSNRMMAREMTLLRALAGTTVPHPTFVAGSENTDILGAAFYLMHAVDGYNAAESLAPGHAADRGARHRMGLAMVDALTELGRVDPVQIGLSDFGRPDGFLDRQVARWSSELESYTLLPGYPTVLLPGVDRIASWLDDHKPRTWTPGILHGDYHVSNVMFDRIDPVLTAIVDWEMATIGDPLLDLGWMLAMWPDTDGGSDLLESRLAAAGGLPSRTELIDRYAANTERDLSAIDWYTALAGFKLGIILEGTYARACSGQASTEVGDRLHRYALRLFDRTLRFLD
ncbi:MULTISPECIES: phosphotransferase family protein [Rhodococcus]|uniref:Phosphotransferase family protein n=1 Tax=Rhodococcus rhodochrous TaxID=1829 RepID=A0AAW4XJE3_RHORH|nr:MULTISPECIES: phosphotransferase family protein [Rhodococcus]MCD2113166.1 phosphotransferase family protein [Rhodococcus rhodochrous]QHG83672.1 phosphotransferase family protein [Rhodococcus rhodochrous]QOH56644.1 phosphotransferase family protein [Rhodococcus rhodochrous]WAL48682.1 phosphotransferase family protein [Rhodococcus pyridinivorans]